MLYADPGDLVFTRSKSVLGKLIRWFEREPGEEPSWPNHVLTCVKGGWLIPPPDADGLAETVEALWLVEHTRWYERHGTESMSLEVWRPNEQTDAGTERERRWLLSRVGNKYGWWKLGLIALQRFTRIAFTDLMFIEERPICSMLSAFGKAYAGVFFDREPMKCTPDNMHDYVRASGDWTFVGRGYINGGANGDNK